MKHSSKDGFIIKNVFVIPIPDVLTLQSVCLHLYLPPSGFLFYTAGNTDNLHRQFDDILAHNRCRNLRPGQKSGNKRGQADNNEEYTVQQTANSSAGKNLFEKSDFIASIDLSIGCFRNKNEMLRPG